MVTCSAVLLQGFIVVGDSDFFLSSICRGAVVPSCFVVQVFDKMPTLGHIRFLFIDQWSNMISSLKLYKIYFLDFTLLTSLLT